MTSTAQPPKRSKFADLQQRDQAAQEAEAMSRRALNALSMTSSIVTALVQNPGSASDSDSLVHAARTMLASADETANKLLSDLDLGNVNWGRFRLMRLATEAVSARWSASARSHGEPSADVSMFMPVWHALSKQDLPSMQYEDPSEDDRVALQIAILDAMQPVMQEIAVFDLFRDPAKSAVHARTQILASVEESLQDLMPQPESRRAQKLLQHALLRNAGTVYASSWRKEANEVLDSLEPLSIDEQKQEVKKRPQGWPIEPVDEGFKIAFAKLTEMVGYLAAPMKEAAAAVEAQNARQTADSAGKSEASLERRSTEPTRASESVPTEIIDVPDWLNDAPEWNDDGPLSIEEVEQEQSLGGSPSARSDGG